MLDFIKNIKYPVVVLASKPQNMVGVMGDYKTRTMLEAADREHGEREVNLGLMCDPLEMPEPRTYGRQDSLEFPPPPSDAEPLSAKVFELAGIADPHSLASRVFGDSRPSLG